MLIYYCKNEKEYHKIIKEIVRKTDMSYDDFCDAFNFIICNKYEYEYDNCEDCPKYDDCCMYDVLDEGFITGELEEYPTIIIYDDEGKLEIHSINQLKQNTKYI